MPTFLNNRWRQRAAGLLVVLYGLCVVAPAAALAFSDGATAAHSLTDDHHAAAKIQLHHDGSSHKHSNTTDDTRGQPGNCCGMFCLSAIAQTTDIALALPVRAAEMPAVPTKSIVGRDSDRIDRPPRSLLSL